MRFSFIVVVGMATCIAQGCGYKSPRVELPYVDAKSAGKEAVRIYDKNGDESLVREELRDCPALLVAFDGLDGDSNDALTSNEIESRIREWQESKAGLVSCRLQVMLDGRPLPDATVLLEPVDFLQPGVLPASGITSDQGYVQMSVAKEHLPAPNIRVLNWGFYTVKVTNSTDHQQVVPEKYSVEKRLGVEVTALGKNEAVIRMRSKG